MTSSFASAALVCFACLLYPTSFSSTCRFASICYLYLFSGTFSLLSLIVAEPVKHITAGVVAVNESDGLNETLVARQVEVAIAVTCFAGIIQVNA